MIQFRLHARKPVTAVFKTRLKIVDSSYLKNAAGLHIMNMCQGILIKILECYLDVFVWVL
jgi:hypothetical protein